MAQNQRSVGAIPIFLSVTVAVMVSLSFPVFASKAQTPPSTDEGTIPFVQECSTCLPAPITTPLCPPTPPSSPPPLLKPPPTSSSSPSPPRPPTSSLSPQPPSSILPPPPPCECAPTPPNPNGCARAPMVPYFPWYNRCSPPPPRSSAAESAQESMIMLSCMFVPFFFSFIF